MSTITQVVPVPLSGIGASVDVSSMVGVKTVVLTGTFKGAYVLYGSHVGDSLAPLFQFDAGGVEGIRHTIVGALARVAVRSLASDASGVTVSISGGSLPGDNTFATLGTLSPGASGPQPSYDLGTSNYQSGLNFILVGGLEGKLVVEGSPDNVGWNPIGQFDVGPSGPGLLATLLAPEFSPLVTEDLVRYVRLNVLGRVVGSLVVTVGGSKSGGGGGGFETLAQTYQVGTIPADQTMVLADVLGGRVVEDASGVGFTETYAHVVLVSDPHAPGSSAFGAGLRRGGGMDLGPYDIVVGFATGGPVVPTSAVYVGEQRIVIGNAVLNALPAVMQRGVVVVGSDITVWESSYRSVIIGSSLTTSHAGGSSTACVVVGYGHSTYAGGEVLVGQNNHVLAGAGNNCVFGNSNSVNTTLPARLNGYFNAICGFSVSLQGDYSQGFGYGLTVTGKATFAAGSLGSVNGDANVFVGVRDGTTVGGIIGTPLVPVYGAVLLGSGGVVYGDRSIAVGFLTAVDAVDSIAVGSYSAVGTGAVYGIAIGGGPVGAGAAVVAGSVGGIAIGQATVAASFSISVGVGSTSVTTGLAVGTGAKANAADTVSVGHTSSADGLWSISIGRQSHSLGDHSVVVGNEAFAGVGAPAGASHVVIGDQSVANTDAVGGRGMVVVGPNCSGYGEGTIVEGRDSHAWGNMDVVLGTGHSVGSLAVAYDYNVVCGYLSTVWGSDSVVVGRQHTVGVDAANPANRVITIGSIITVGATADSAIAIGSDVGILGGAETLVIGVSAGAGPASLSSIAIGAHSFVSNAYSMAFGTQSQTLANNQVVFGSSSSAGAYAAHEFVVRGYNGAALNTIDVVDNPVDSGNPNLGVTGLTVVYTQNAVVTNQTLKAALLANLPGGALVAYF
jgi:hypothetical protein